jgi:hypothetical protein
LGADTVRASQSVIAGRVRVASTVQLTLSASPVGVVVVTTTATERHHAAQYQQKQSQSLLQSHLLDPFPSERLEAFHFALTKASLLEKSA